MDEYKGHFGARDGLGALGANLPSRVGLPRETLARAVEALSVPGFRITALSRLYRTPAFPAGSGPDYANAAFAFRTDWSAEAVLAHFQAVEAQLGRVRGARWQARVIDIDLLAMGDAVLPDAATQARWRDLAPERQAVEVPGDLILPHPRIADRSFVLVPLAEIAAPWRHPLTGATVAEMLASRPAAERAEVVPIPWEPVPAVRLPLSSPS